MGISNSDGEKRGDQRGEKSICQPCATSSKENLDDKLRGLWKLAMTSLQSVLRDAPGL